MSKIGILVVEDYEPFRRFVCSTLGKRPELHIVGEASDWLEAVQKAEELQPALILLDIGLPSLNGIEVAGRIQDLAQVRNTFCEPRIFSRCGAKSSQRRGGGVHC